MQVCDTSDSFSLSFKVLNICYFRHLIPIATSNLKLMTKYHLLFCSFNIV
jgi:hypothetical protein